MTTKSRDERILGIYESIGRVSRTMVAAAERADWESLEAGGRVCGLLIECIEAYGDVAEELGPTGRQRRMAILRDVLADDAEIRRHTEPSMSRLDLMLGPPARRGRGG
jgi:flagellar protein FliT